MSKDRYYFCLLSTDKEVVVLRRNMNQEEVIIEETGTDVANVSERDSSSNVPRCGINVIYSTI